MDAGNRRSWNRQRSAHEKAQKTGLLRVRTKGIIKTSSQKPLTKNALREKASRASVLGAFLVDFWMLNHQTSVLLC